MAYAPEALDEEEKNNLLPGYYVEEDALLTQVLSRRGKICQYCLSQTTGSKFCEVKRRTCEECGAGYCDKECFAKEKTFHELECLFLRKFMKEYNISIDDDILNLYELGVKLAHRWSGVKFSPKNKHGIHLDEEANYLPENTTLNNLVGDIRLVVEFEILKVSTKVRVYLAKAIQFFDPRGTYGSGYFPKSAHLKHSCDFNSGIMTEKHKIRVSLIKRINISESEITIPKYNIFLPFKERKKLVSKYTGAECKCEFCLVINVEREQKLENYVRDFKQFEEFNFSDFYNEQVFDYRLPNIAFSRCLDELCFIYPYHNPFLIDLLYLYHKKLADEKVNLEEDFEKLYIYLIQLILWFHPRGTDIFVKKLLDPRSSKKFRLVWRFPDITEKAVDYESQILNRGHYSLTQEKMTTIDSFLQDLRFWLETHQ